ncbi:MAG: hypothetical protein JRD93_01820 [Deltaproteobacteria bacterium]|nr:hypothetical protein [Deltaproteobacteria bacterium]MBW2660735.1 hypothetical protein [Deltaproteobacteria bacterium]
MKKLVHIFSCFFLVLILFVPFNDALSWVKNSDGIQLSKDEVPILITANSSSSDKPDIYEQAKTLFKEKKYDDVITLLSGSCYNNPTNVELNTLLAKAQVEKCAILKEKGDKSYKAIIKQPYITGVRLHKTIGPRPEFYYIVAKSLLINGRSSRAKKTIKKALYYEPNNADYLIVLGDAYCVQAELRKNDEDRYYANQLFSKAKDAYNNALKTRMDDKEFRTIVENKIEQLSEKARK